MLVLPTWRKLAGSRDEQPRGKVVRAGWCSLSCFEPCVCPGRGEAVWHKERLGCRIVTVTGD